MPAFNTQNHIKENTPSSVTWGTGAEQFREELTKKRLTSLTAERNI